MPRDAAPGERLNYSNLGYAALGRVIEKVTGKTYEAHLRDALLGPLGMKDTGCDRRDAAVPDRATGYLFDPAKGMTLAEYTDSGNDFAGGGLYSTAEDMARWVRALQEGRIVSLATLEKAWTPVTLESGRRGPYGYGFMLVPFRGLREIGHGGDISGFHSYVALYPAEKLAVVVLPNVGMRPPGPVPEAGAIAHQVVEVLAGGRIGPPWPPAGAGGPEVLARYVGSYRIEVPPPVAAVMGDSLEIRRDGARLLAKGKQGETEIVPESPTEFYSKEGPVRISFMPQADGAPARGVLILMGLREFRLTR
jgi:hypothetical protein